MDNVVIEEYKDMHELTNEVYNLLKNIGKHMQADLIIEIDVKNMCVIVEDMKHDN